MKLTKLIHLLSVLMVLLMLVMGVLAAVIMGNQTTAYTEQSALAQLWFSLLSAVTGLFGLGALWVIYHKLKPIAYLQQIVEQVKQGDIYHIDTEKPTAKDEIGQLVQATYETVEVIKRIDTDLTRVLKDYVDRGDMDARMQDHPSYAGEWQILVDDVNLLMNTSTQEMTSVINTMERLADGNTDLQIPQMTGKKADLTDKLNKVDGFFKNYHAAVLELARSAQAGDFSHRIDSRDYRGRWLAIGEAMTALIDAVEKPLSEVRNMMEHMQVGDFQYRIAGSYQGAFASLTDSMTDTSTVISSYITEIQDVLKNTAEGDLTTKISRDYVGQFDNIKLSINTIINQLSRTLDDVGHVANGVLNGTHMLAQSSQSLSNDASEQMRAMAEVTQGLAQVDNQSKDNTTSAQKAASLAQLSQDNAEQGNAEMAGLMDAMGKINASSNEIVKIIKVIEEIAFQTNLLALNASVEAARAGEHGRGFSVVAEEVRALAERSAGAAGQTNALIEESMASVDEGVKRAQDTASSLSQIVGNVKDVFAVVGDIHQASLEQTHSLDSLTQSLNQINHSVANVADTSEQTSVATLTLNTQVDILNEKLAFFKTKGTTIKLPTLDMVWGKQSIPTTDLSKIRAFLSNEGEQTFSQGQVIIQEGEPGDSMYYVLSGTVGVYKAHGALNEKHLASLSAGNFFGEMAVFLNEARSATVVAESSVTLLEIGMSNLDNFITTNPDATKNMLATLSTRLKNVLVQLDSY